MKIKCWSKGNSEIELDKNLSNLILIILTYNNGFEIYFTWVINDSHVFGVCMACTGITLLVIQAVLLYS